MTSKEAARHVLEEAGEPLHYEAITERMLEAGYWSTNGETPAATVNAQIAVSIDRNGDASPFQRVAPGLYALREWGLEPTSQGGHESEDEPLDLDDDRRVRVPHFPTFADARALLRVLEGIPEAVFQTMALDIRDQTGTPKNPVNWSDPDTWIEERLSGESARLARRIWDETHQAVNPRYTRGAYSLLTTYGLTAVSAEGRFTATSRGQRFLDGDAAIERVLDEQEGLGTILTILAPKGRAKRADLLPEWSDYLDTYSRYGSTTSQKGTLRERLVNLIDRDLVERDGQMYTITKAGQEYAASFAQEEGGDPKQELQEALTDYNEAQRAALRERLATMDPVHFEELVRDLLEAMGYEDVQVTKQSGDKGVDVVGDVQLGITEIKEVVQVKRTKSPIGRPVLDQLRGALPYHEAIRGTIIALGGFTSGCEKGALHTGAAPITLIDGDRLIDLLIEHEIGIQKKPAVMYEVDERYFEGDGE